MPLPASAVVAGLRPLSDSDSSRSGFAITLRMLQEEHEAEVTQLVSQVAQLETELQFCRGASASVSGPRAQPAAPPPMPAAECGEPTAVTAASKEGSALQHKPLSIRKGISDTKFVRKAASDATISSLGCVWESEDASSRTPTLEMIQAALHRPSTMIASVEDISSRASCRTRFLSFLDGVVGVAIVMNTIVLGVSADVRSDWFGWVCMDVGFAALFFTEIYIRFCSYGWRWFLFGSDRATNIIELAMVLFAVVEAAVAIADRGAANPAQMQGMVVFALLRLFRVFRVLRILRLEIFGELKLMVRGTLGGMRTLLWSTVLILLPVFIVSLVLRKTLGPMHERGKGAEYFGSVPSAFFAVFRCFLIGECADDKGRPLLVNITEAYGWGFALIFCATAVFMSFGLLNVIVAMFVENVVAASKSKSVHMRKQRLQDKGYFARKIAKLLDVILHVYDNHMSMQGEPSYPQEGLLDRQRWVRIPPDLFEVMRRDRRVQDLFDDLDLADEDQLGLFDTLDADKNGLLDLEELCSGIQKLRGEACRSDIISINLMIQGVRAELRSMARRTARHVTKLQDAILQMRTLQF